MVGDARVIDRKGSPEDAAPLIAAVAAVGGLTRPETEAPSAYEAHDLMFV